MKYASTYNVRVLDTVDYYDLLVLRSSLNSKNSSLLLDLRPAPVQWQKSLSKVLTGLLCFQPFCQVTQRSHFDAEDEDNAEVNVKYGEGRHAMGVGNGRKKCSRKNKKLRDNDDGHFGDDDHDDDDDDDDDDSFFFHQKPATEIIIPFILGEDVDVHSDCSTCSIASSLLALEGEETTLTSWDTIHRPESTLDLEDNNAEILVITR